MGQTKGAGRLTLKAAAALAVAAAAGACGSSPQASPGGSQGAGYRTSSTRPVTVAPAGQPSTTSPARVGPAIAPPGGPVPAHFDPVSFTAISATTYWLLGEAPCSNPVCTSIVRTTDGGTSFVGLPAPQAPLDAGNGTGGGSAGAGINTLRFADPLDGYAFDTNPGGSFWDTHDGGQHWAQPAFFAGQDLLGFGTGDGYAFALAGTCTNGSCAKVVLQRSPVGSDQWSPLSVPVPSGALPVASMTVHGPDVWFSVTTSASQANQLLVAGTGGGATFSTYPSPCSPGLGGDIQATSATVLWAVCPTGTLASAFRSTDGGAQWQSLKTPDELANSAVLAAASDTAAVIEPSAQGPLLRTDDGGAGWQAVKSSGSAGSWWAWMGFTDSATGAGLQVQGSTPAGWPWPNGPAPEQLWRTGDGGATWSGPVSVG